MTELHITRGLPGSGKSTWARQWVAENPSKRARVNRDDLRKQMHDGFWNGSHTEGQIIAARDAMIVTLLKRGIDVVNDDTNLPQRTARDLRKLAYNAGADLVVKDFTWVDVEECIARDAERSVMLGDDKDPVGEQVIQDMHDRYLKGKKLPLPDPGEAPADLSGFAIYEPKLGLPDAIMVDIDGTIALKGTRNPFDESLVHEDLPNSWVIREVWLHKDAGHQIVFCSGRRDSCREATENWIWTNLGIQPDYLFMRKAGDTRKDSIVKLELFDKHIRDNFNVLCVYDDRDQVVDAWRSIGLGVCQVAPGTF